MGIIDKSMSRELEENFAVLKHVRVNRQEIDANLKEMMEKIEQEGIRDQKKVLSPLQTLPKVGGGKKLAPITEKSLT